MATMILLEKPYAAEVARIYRERLMQQAELAAKKELVSMSTAIDAAAAKGNMALSYRLSGSVTRLVGEYRDAAMVIINADIEAAGYTAVPTEKNGAVIGYELSWDDASDNGSNEDQNGENEPVNPGDNTNPDDGENGDDNGNTDPVNPDPVDPEPVDPEPIEDTPVVAEDQDLSHYSEVTPGGTENPAQEGWFEVVNNQIVESTDTVVDLTKDYYELTWEPVEPEDLPPVDD